MDEDVLGYLQTKGLHLKPADKRNVHTACFFCNESSGKRGRLYINVDPNNDIPGAFYCHLCGEKGSITKIRRHFGDPTDNKPDLGEIHYDLIRSAAEFFHANLASQAQVIQWLTVERGLTPKTIRHFRLGWGDRSVIPHLKSLGHTEEQMTRAGFLLKNGDVFFDGVVTIPYYTGPTCVGIREKRLGGKYRQPFG